MLPLSRVLQLAVCQQHASVSWEAAALLGERLLSSSAASCSQRAPSASPLGHRHRSKELAQGPLAKSSDQQQTGSVPVHMVRSEYAYDDEGQAGNRLKFVSRERRLVPRPPFYRPPIYFPDTTLQMLKLTDQQRQQIKETGWTREVAFKTTPNVTKLEIKGLLEAMYGMQVERVHTINYLGKKHVTFSSRGSKPVRKEWRADDWKKAYVLFHPPAGMEHLLQESQPSSRLPMIEQLLIAKKVIQPPKPAPSEAHQELQGEPGASELAAEPAQPAGS